MGSRTTRSTCLGDRDGRAYQSHRFQITPNIFGVVNGVVNGLYSASPPLLRLLTSFSTAELHMHRLDIVLDPVQARQSRHWQRKSEVILPSHPSTPLFILPPPICFHFHRGC
jgi:hypothetical protein